MEASQTKTRLWTKDFVLVLFITCLATTAITTQMGTLPLFVAEKGGSAAASGAIVGILGISALFFRIPIGAMLDRYGRRLLLIVGLGILFLDFGLLNIFQSLLMLFCLRLIQGIGNSVQATASGTMVADLIPRDKLSVGLGYFSIAQAVPGAIGPLVGLSVAENYGFEALFRVALVLTAIAFGLSFFLRDYYPVTKALPKNSLSAGSLTVLKNRLVLFPSAVMFLICFANSGVVAFIAQYAIEKDIVGAGYYFTVMSVVTVLVRLLFPSLLTKLNQSFLIGASIFLIILSFSLLAFSNQLAHLLLAAVCYGVGYANLLPLMNTIVLQNVSDYQRGQATAVFSAALDVAYGGGAMLWGIVAGFFGFQTMYLACSFCGVIALFTFIRFLKKI